MPTRSSPVRASYANMIRSKKETKDLANKIDVDVKEKKKIRIK